MKKYYENELNEANKVFQKRIARAERYGKVEKAENIRAGLNRNLKLLKYADDNLMRAISNSGMIFAYGDQEEGCLDCLTFSEKDELKKIEEKET
jgi:hypothetical protein